MKGIEDMRFKRHSQKRVGVSGAGCVLMMVLFSGSTGAQVSKPFAPSANPVTDAVRNALTKHAKSLIGAAELMSAEKYGYQPTPGQMTFGALMAHVVQTNVAICSAFTETMPPMRPEELKKISGSDSKDSLVAAIKQSFDYCSAALAKLEDGALREEARIFGRNAGLSRADALVTIAIDWADHYSTAASYLRLNGIVPPTAQAKP
jgi:uncharacterized damage-inducible protein DinB